jgi:hypothetical protein
MDPEPAAEAPTRREILRDVAVFQVKLWVEGVKDVVLIPLSLGAALVDLVLRRRGGRGALYAVMRLGDRFEQWVDLYGPLGRGPDSTLAPPPPSGQPRDPNAGENDTGPPDGPGP